MREAQPAPYERLGLRRDATPDAVQQAYRRAARDSHPDRMPGDPDAASRFAAVTDAYETLRDPRRRAAYDAAHPQPTGSILRGGPSTHAIWSLSVRYVAAPSRRPALWAGPVHITPPRRG